MALSSVETAVALVDNWGRCKVGGVGGVGALAFGVDNADDVVVVFVGAPGSGMLALLGAPLTVGKLVVV